jgi:CheY-like chemotaxis protein
MTLDFQWVDVHEIIRRAYEVCCAEAHAAGLDLVLSLEAAQYHAWVDATRIQQLFWNLIQNAIKFTPAGGKVRIRSRTVDDPSDPGLTVEVTDTGIGIEADLLPRIFRAFEQGETAPYRRRSRGLGLGLAIGRSVAEAHGGRLTAASPGPGRGATFPLELAMDGDASPAVTSAPPKLPDEMVPTRLLRILVVEDNLHILEYLTLLLSQRRHVVRGATDLAAARRLAAAEDFDLLISDIELGDGTGLELMHDLRKTSPIPGIAISGFGSEDDLRMSRTAGFSEHLTKPIDIRTLETTIERVSRSMQATGPLQQPVVEVLARPGHCREYCLV